MKARDVPAMVYAHQQALLGEKQASYCDAFFRKALAERIIKDPQKWDDVTMFNFANKWRQEEHDWLNISRLFHVTDSMTAVAVQAARKLDSDAVWSMEVLPSLHGILVFEKPLYVRDAWRRKIGIAATSWHWDSQIQRVAFNHYTDLEDMEDSYNKMMMASDNSKWMFDGGMGRWVLGHVNGSKMGTMESWITNEDPEIEQYRQSHPDLAASDFENFGPQETLPDSVVEFANVDRILFTILTLMDQTITSLSEETDHKLARRFHNKRRPPPMVTVIQLRRKEYFGYHEPGTGNFLVYRSITSSHWRRQHYGPGRHEVKRIFIAAYWRGGKDLPIYQPKRINTLSR